MRVRTSELPTFRELKSPTLRETPCTSGCWSRRLGKFRKFTTIPTKKCRSLSRRRPHTGSRSGKESDACSRKGCLRESRLLSSKRRSDACKSRFNHREETHSLRCSAATFSLPGQVRHSKFSSQPPPTQRLTMHSVSRQKHARVVRSAAPDLSGN